MSDYPLVKTRPLLYVWDRGWYGHLAWSVRGTYSSYLPSGTARDWPKLGTEDVTMRDGQTRTLGIYRAPVDSDQTYQRDVEKFRGPPDHILEVPGLNSGPMEMLARQLYRSGRNEQPQQLAYVLDRVRVAGPDGQVNRVVTRSNCVTHALSLFCAGLSGVELAQGFRALHPAMAMGPQANDFSRYFRATEMYEGEDRSPFASYYQVGSVHELCKAFNAFHPGQFQPPIRHNI